MTVTAFLLQKQITILHHSLHSPDLATCDYYLLKIFTRGKRYGDIPDIQNTALLQNSQRHSTERHTIGIAAGGMYFE